MTLEVYIYVDALTMERSVVDARTKRRRKTLSKMGKTTFTDFSFFLYSIVNLGSNME